MDYIFWTSKIDKSIFSRSDNIKKVVKQVIKSQNKEKRIKKIKI